MFINCLRIVVGMQLTFATGRHYFLIWSAVPLALHESMLRRVNGSLRSSGGQAEADIAKVTYTALFC